MQDFVSPIINGIKHFKPFLRTGWSPIQNRAIDIEKRKPWDFIFLAKIRIQTEKYAKPIRVIAFFDTDTQLSPWRNPQFFHLIYKKILIRYLEQQMTRLLS